MGLLRLINAGRLAPLEELLAELGSGTGTKAASAGRSAVSAAPTMPAKREMANAAAVGSYSSTSAQPIRESFSSTSFSSTAAVEPVAQRPPVPSFAPVREVPPEPTSVREAAPEPTKTLETSTTKVSAQGLSEEQVFEIRAAIQAQQKFLGELVEHGHRWELEGMELRIYFATDKRPFAEMIEGRDSIEKVRAASSKVLGKSVRVCAKIENVAGSSAPQSASLQELRAQFERDPMVKSMLQRFGGKISEVKRPVN
jgi:hypothetical protein